jgi:hypothetical protein
MPMLKVCSAHGCATKTLGEFCVEHEGLPPRGKIEVRVVLEDFLAQLPSAPPSLDARRDRSRTSSAR